jgi:hypothetical protein
MHEAELVENRERLGKNQNYVCMYVCMYGVCTVSYVANSRIKI